MFLPLALNGERVNLKTEGGGEHSEIHQQGKGGLRYNFDQSSEINLKIKKSCTTVK